MLSYILKRLAGVIPLLLLLTILAFGLLHILPGDPVEVMLGSSEKDLSPQQLSIIRHDFGLDRSLPEQYLAWLKEVLKGNLGRSYRDGRPVFVLIAERLPSTVVLVGSALAVSVILGTLWGAFMLWLGLSKPRRWFDQISASLALVLYCLPSFWLAFLLIACLAQTSDSTIKLPLRLLGLHPPGQSGICPASLILPAGILASRRTAKWALLLRTVMNEEMEKEYVRTARAKGLSWAATVTRHVARNSIGPLITFLGLSVPALIGGSVLVEIVFAWPGMGRLAVDAAFGRNYPVLLGLTLVYGTLVIISNLAADVIQRLTDPRIAAQEEGDLFRPVKIEHIHA